jgi:hypothetical protein
VTANATTDDSEHTRKAVNSVSPLKEAFVVSDATERTRYILQPN